MRRLLELLRTAHAELERSAARDLVGAPHRGLPTDTAAVHARADRRAEVAHLDHLLRRRAVLWTVVPVVITVGVIGAIMAFAG